MNCDFKNAVSDKNLLLSVKPHFAEKIVIGKKSIELRRRLPLGLPTGGTAIIYASSPLKRIIGFAIIEELIVANVNEIWNTFSLEACVERNFFDSYFKDASVGFALRLSHPIRLEQPISLQEMRSRFAISPPQSFRYSPPSLTEYVLNR